mgnify:CR=1 FL=1
MRYETFGHKDKRSRSNRKQLQSKRVLAGALLLLVLAVPVTAVPVMVNAQETEQSSGALQASGTLAAADVVGSAEKKEVVYATLDGSGTNKSAYVVNVLEGNAGETVQDFGAYEQVANLTDTSELTQLSDSVIATLPEGEFSYQGSLSDAQTPWNISVKYFLDGQEISPNEVAGKSGHLEITIQTSQNTSVDPRYFENYLMQITCTLPMENTTEVKTDQGSIALSGSDVTVSFMVMPDKEGNVSLSADVTNFEMSGISFAAIPFSMALDFPNTDSLVAQFDGLIEGTEQLHAGAQDLANGVDEVDSATKQAASGAAELAAGATQMTQGLQQYQQGLRDSADDAASSVSEEEIQKASDDYQQAVGAYTAAFAQAYEGILSGYGTPITDEIKQRALAQAAQNPVVSDYQANMANKLENLMTLVAAQGGSQGAAQALTGAAEGLGSLEDTSSLLGGSASLRTGVQELASGLDQLAGGTGDLSEGTSDLAQGTQTLAQETQGIPDAVQAEIDELMSAYDKSDFEPASFTSSKNTNVTLVQFVMTTDSIKVDEPTAAKEPAREETLLDRFLALF